MQYYNYPAKRDKGLDSRLRENDILEIKKFAKVLYNKIKGKSTYEAHIHYGYTLKEIAEYSGVHFRLRRICLWLKIEEKHV